MNFNNEIQEYKMYPMLHFRRKFSSGVTALKKAFTTAPVLRIPNDEDLFKLSTDTSDFVTGAVLSQKNIQTNLWHPVAFFLSH